MPRRRRPVVTGPERNQSRSNQASRADVPPGHVVVDQATDLAFLCVVDVLAEIARETDVTLGREQTVSEVKHED